MGFSDKVKREVKELADFRCCICNRFDVEIHHIIQPNEGGSNEIDNAAPLCPNHHDLYGGHPEKIKLIRLKRDSWYAQVAEQRKKNPDIKEYTKQISELDERITNKDSIIDKQKEDIFSLKETLNNFVIEFISKGKEIECRKLINNITPESAVSSSSAVVNSAYPDAIFPSMKGTELRASSGVIGESASSWSVVDSSFLTDPSSGDNHKDSEEGPK